MITASDINIGDLIVARHYTNESIYYVMYITNIVNDYVCEKCYFSSGAIEEFFVPIRNVQMKANGLYTFELVKC
jgi:hypothetical protein